MDSKTISLITIPLFTGAIGYVTNWTGVWMLFYPIRFHGIRVPGLKAFSNLLPRKLQQIPGVMHGGIGWQGIVPSRAAKMGSIAVDKGIAKLGGAGEFYERLDSEAIAEHVLENASGVRANSAVVLPRQRDRVTCDPRHLVRLVFRWGYSSKAPQTWMWAL